MKQQTPLTQAVLWIASAVLILAGVLLFLWGWGDLRPAASAPMSDEVMAPGQAESPVSDRATGLDDGTPQPAFSDDTTAPTATATASPTPAEPLLLALPQPLPPELEQGLMAWLEQRPNGQIVSDPAAADLWLTTEPTGDPLIERIYVPVARFATVDDAVEGHDLLGLWLGGPAGNQQPLALTPDSAAGLTLLWGEPASADVLADSDAVAAALEPARGRLGVVPFDQLVPELKVMTLGGLDPSDNAFDPTDYLLVLRLYLGSRPEAKAAADDLQAFVAQSGLHTNRDPDKLTVLVMTGVTAMARMTALRMEQNGYDYPARKVRTVLAAADLTHISNEIPFVADCQVNASENNITLCSKPEYLQAMRDVGVDLVGLTGNHLNDFGKDASLASMQFYRDEDLPTFGGGANLAESQEPLVIEHNGNRLVFLGANYFGPQIAWAEPDWPGSAPYDYQEMATAIQRARDGLDADLVLVDLQWEESYDTLPIQSQRQGFRALSAAGADIVTGVQSHVPQAVEFGQGGMILYGLGNFFFDQMWSLPTREGLIPRHTIYDGRHLSTRLLTTMLEDFAQPRWMTDAERADLLRQVFTASGW
jgi:poly-gamma-glutamate synthesis protein (capsule biosynthesis protein)